MSKASDAASDWGSTASAKRKQLDARGISSAHISVFISLCSLFAEKMQGESNMGKVIDYIRQAPDGFFLYLSHLYSRNDTRHSYYNLKFVGFLCAMRKE